MAINVSLNAFTDAAQNAGGALRVTDDGRIQKSSGLRKLFMTKTAHRETMGQFLSALKAQYGEHVANLAARDLQGAISAGKPLTARAIHAVVGEAERIQRSLTTFLIGVDPSGTPIEHSLDKAVEAWETAHPREAARMTPEERETVKRRITEELMAGNPVCHSPEEMFQAVLNKDLRPPISGNVQIPSARTGAAAVAARERTEAEFTQYMGEMPGKELLRNQQRGRDQPTFEKDLIRGTDLTVGNHRVVNKAADLPNPPRPGQSEAQALAENGHDEIARLLTGQEGVRFADLSETQKKQVLLLSGLCCQEMENPAILYSQNSLLDPSDGGLTIPKNRGSRPIHLEMNSEGNFVVRYDAKLPVSDFTCDGNGKQEFVDSEHSQLGIHVELVISPNELERLAGLDWTDVSTRDVPESHQMHFVESHLSSSLTLYALE